MFQRERYSISPKPVDWNGENGECLFECDHQVFITLRPKWAVNLTSEGLDGFIETMKHATTPRIIELTKMGPDVPLPSTGQFVLFKYTPPGGAAIESSVWHTPSKYNPGSLCLCSERHLPEGAVLEFFWVTVRE